ncbi:hypothetical protein GCM10010185_10980 [Saccharothrix coeruleofusca]|uniref:Uncharacterized protein n=1 Tax=Saccharothrix coeruleofusca TaxID=33919 RepID=A0A918AHQ7_9PSEU|nr:hypothetical protein GCM10010185_10980 [Saccharothrix coeruleofusca]
MAKAQHSAARAATAAASGVHGPASAAAGANPLKIPAPSIAPRASTAALARGVTVTAPQSQMERPLANGRTVDTCSC